MKRSKYRSIRNQYQVVIENLGKWLKNRNYATETIRADENYTASFLAWAGQEQTQVTEVSYNDLLTYIDYCTIEGDSKALINRKLSAIRKYYDYLQYLGKAIKNPASGLFIRDKRQTVPSNLLSIEETYSDV